MKYNFFKALLVVQLVLLLLHAAGILELKHVEGVIILTMVDFVLTILYQLYLDEVDE